MRIAVCDDDKNYSQLLSNYVKSYFTDKHIQLECEEYASGEDLLNSKLNFDIVFLDIEMKEISGIKVSEELNKRNKNTVIFIVTSYNSYLDDAMDLKVFRFIDKKLISPERIYTSLDKALLQINQGHIVIEAVDNEIVKIPKNDIMYVEVNKRKTTVVTADGRYVTYKALNYFKDQLTSNDFVIPHNSFIVNLNFVKKYRRDVLTMKDDFKINISQRKQPEIRRLFFAFAMED